MQANTMIMRKTVNKSDLNCNGSLFGGELMKWMDQLAYDFASRLIGETAVTVQVKEINFIIPAKEGDAIELCASLSKTNAASIELEILSNIKKNSNRMEHSKAIFIMAAINKNGKPLRIKK
jgi:acyl-CoA hydrolase